MYHPYYRVWLNVSKDGWIMEPGLYAEPIGKAQVDAQRLANKLGVETAVVRHYPSKPEQKDFVRKYQPEGTK